MIPRWLIWMFLAVFATMLYQVNGRAPVSSQQSPTRSPTASANYSEIVKVTDAEHWKESLNPDYAILKKACAPVGVTPDRLHVLWTQTADGSGAGVACGETITVRIRRADAQGKWGAEIIKELEVGKSGVVGLDAALVGLSVGAQRVVIVPATKPGSASPLRGSVSPSQTSILTITR